MKKVEILAIGTELLMGMTANTNAQVISADLAEIGLGVYWHTVVGDNPERMRDAISRAVGRADVVILTGGLGPTKDDITKDLVAETLGLPMVEDPESCEKIRRYFADAGKTMVPSNLRQGVFPRGAVIFPNGRGTAPGCAVRDEKTGTVLILLPGPPSEMKPMFRESVLPFLRGESDVKILSRFVQLAGVSESLAEEKMMHLVEGQTNPTLATYVKNGIVTVRVTSSADTEEEADALNEKTCRELRRLFGDSVFSEKGESVEEAFVRLCEREKLSFSCAESCTGGLIAEMITRVSGASHVFSSGIVTYSNEAKTKLLGVPEEMLKEFGAVSKEMALAMVKGAVKSSGAQVAVSVTGNAGPGCMEGKPQGLVYIGVYCRGKAFAEGYRFGGDRENVRLRAANKALDLARRMIEETRTEL